jgi:hypothetical protein
MWSSSLAFDMRSSILLAMLCCFTLEAFAAAPYAVAPNLFDPAKPDLGLRPAAGTQTISIFKPGADDDKFNNGVVVIAFKGKLYAQWQSSAKDEDSPDTWVAYSVSDDGVRWRKPAVLASAGEGGRMHSSGGWWTNGDTLVAYINVWPTGFQSRAGGFTQYVTSRDGHTWSAAKYVTDQDGRSVPGVIEQDPHALPDGRLINAFHLQPGILVEPFYTDDALGISGWRRGKFQHSSHEEWMSRELEPSVFLRGACAVMVFRDQSSSYRQLASESCDRGQTWSPAVLTDMPDSRAKQSAGNLPNGTAFLVNAPNADKLRIPLAVTLSADGRLFERSFLLRGAADLQPLRYEGRYKRPGYNYPKSTIWNGFLYVAYATNKEDVEVTRVPLASLEESN